MGPRLSRISLFTQCGTIRTSDVPWSFVSALGSGVDLVDMGSFCGGSVWGDRSAEKQERSPFDLLSRWSLGGAHTFVLHRSRMRSLGTGAPPGICQQLHSGDRLGLDFGPRSLESRRSRVGNLVSTFAHLSSGMRREAV